MRRLSRSTGSRARATRAVASVLACWVLLFGAGTARAFSVAGVDFSDFLVFQVPAAGNLTLSTSQDVYVYAPDAIVADVLDLTAGGILQVFQSITANTLSFCANGVCDTSPPYDYDRDVVVAFSGPIGNVTLLAAGTIVVDSTAIPEPATGLLLALGVLGAAIRSPRSD